MARVEGIDPKVWFYGFKSDLANRAPAIRERLAGAAAEGWLNLEFFRWLQDFLRSNRKPFVTYNEFGKTDLAVFSVLGGAVQKPPCAVMEAKAIYSNHSNGQIRERLATLLIQLEQRRKAFPEARIFGLIYGVYAFWHDDRSYSESFSAFRKRIRGIFSEVARGEGSRLAKPCMETAFPEGRFALSSELSATVGLCVQYVEQSSKR